MRINLNPYGADVIADKCNKTSQYNMMQMEIQIN